MRTIFVYLALLSSFLGFSQTPFPQQEIQYSPGGKFDKVFDHYGNEYSLEDIKIDTVSLTTKSVSFPNECNSGYFKLYYEVNSGFEIQGNPIHQQRRAVLCQLFYDMSQFIIPVNPNTPVNIFVREFNNSDLSNPLPANTLAYASSTYLLAPITNSSIGGGVADNAIWQTINSGVDPYYDFSTPLMQTAGSAGFYHGIIAFNFNNSWLTNLPENQFPSNVNSLYDLYSVGLHEITHALGFASLINELGQSKFGSYFPYFSRYDKFLKTTSGVNLISNSGSCGSMYNFGFNPLLDLSLLVSDGSNCSTTDLVKFGGSVNQNIYTNPDFEDASSLSHLEDQCHVPNSQPDNQYYVMSEANGTGVSYIKRFLKEEERQVLCDLGYKVNFVYGNSANLTYKEYGQIICGGNQIVGINDGITNNSSGNTYTYVVNNNSQNPIPISNFLSNDFNPNSSQLLAYECAESVYGYGNVTPLNGSNSTPLNYLPNGTGSGLDLIRYIPILPNGQKGNITYIYIYIYDGNCLSSTCDSYVSNGGFENSSSCGSLGVSSSSCWSAFALTPDLFTTNINDCNYPQCEIPSTFFSNPATNTWSQTTNNNYFIGFFGGEGAQNKLNTPLLPNINYILRFRAKIGNNVPAIGISNLLFGGSTSPSALSSSVISTPLFLTTLHVQEINNYDWKQFEIPISFNGNSINYLTLINANYIPNSGFSYVFVDDIEIIEENSIVEFNPTTSFCSNQPVDLLNYTNMSGGTFSGSGIIGTLFYPNIAGVGSHDITYTFISSNNCTTDITKTIIVHDLNTAPQILSNCTGSSVILTVENSFNNFIWSTGQTNQSITVSPTSTTVYSITASNACGNILNSTITINPNDFYLPLNPSISPFGPTVCSGTSTTLTVNNNFINNYEYLWSNGATTTSTVVNPVINTAYYLTITNSNGCKKTIVNLVYVNNPIANIIVNTPTAFCSIVLNATTNSGNTYQWQLNGSNISGANSSSYTATQTGNYTVIVTNNNCQATSSAVVVSINSIIAQINPASSTTFCAGGSVVLNATTNSGNTYQWQLNGINISGATSSNYSATQAGSYTVVITNSGCHATSSAINVFVNSVNVPICCTPAGTTYNEPFNASVLTNNSIIQVNANMTVNQNLTFTGCTFRMGPNVKIIVNTGAILTLTNCTLFSCSEMWDGIEVLTGGNLILNGTPGTRIEDAKEAIKSIGNASISINNAKFNKNKIGLHLRAWNSSFNSINNSTFDCTGSGSPSSPNAFMKAPFANEKSHYGIYLYKMENVTIGGTNLNSFQNLEVGIYAEACTNLTIQRNNFTNINTTCPVSGACTSATLKGWCIYVYGIENVTIGNSTNNVLGNTFTSSFNGIALVTTRTFGIHNNSFSNIFTLPVWNGNSLIYTSTANCISISDYSGVGSNNFIQNNSFLDFDRGIFYTNNVSNSLTISQNRISNFNINKSTGVHILDNPLQSFTIRNNIFNVNTNQTGGRAIIVENVNTSFATGQNLSIRTNTIRNVNRGIWITNYNSPQIIDHNSNLYSIGSGTTGTRAGIYFPATLTGASVGNENAGIHINNCPSATISNNTIERTNYTATAPAPLAANQFNLQFGISVGSSCTGTQVSNNVIKLMGSGIYYFGNTPISLKCNNMVNNATGLWLNGQIGQQGTVNSPQDNKWTIPAGYLGVRRNGNPNISSSPVFFTRALFNSSPTVTSQFMPNINTQMFPNSAINPPNPQPATINAANLCFISAPPPAGLVQIVNEEGEYSYLSDEELKTLDLDLFKTLKISPDLYNESTFEGQRIEEFMDSVNLSNSAKIYEYEEKLSLKDTLEAKELLALFEAYSDVEQTYKSVYEIYNRSWLDGVHSFTAEDSLILNEIAYLSPRVAGNAVYTARVLLGLMIIDTETYAAKSTQIINSNTNTYLKIFPNPSNDYFYYFLPLKEDDKGLVSIIDISGKEIQTWTANSTTNQGSLDIHNYAKGIYLFELTINGNQKLVQKLIVK